MPSPSTSFPRPFPSIRAAMAGLLLLAALYSLQWAQPVVLPLVFALLLSFALKPLDRSLARKWIPQPLRALLAVLAFVSGLALVLGMAAAPAISWLEKLPATVPQIQTKLSSLKKHIEKVKETTEQVEKITALKDENGDKTVVVEERGLVDQVSEKAPDFFVGAITTFFLLYFLLASRDFFLRKTLKTLSSQGAKKKMVRCVRAIELDISLYFRTAAAVHTGVGIVVGLMLFLLGAPDPIFGGIVAGLLNFIPYFGPAITFIVLAVLAVVSFTDTQTILLVPLLYLLITFIDGQVIQPMAMGHSLKTHPVTILLSVLFWGWLWGIAGLFLAVPLLLVIRRVCDSVDALRPFTALLGR